MFNYTIAAAEQIGPVSNRPGPTPNNDVEGGIDVPDVPPQHPVAAPRVVPEAERDQFHLQLLSIFYDILSALCLLGICGGAVYLVLGVAAVRNPGPFAASGAQPIPIDAVFFGFGGAIILITLVMSILCFLTARMLNARRRIILCYITAALVCLSVPVGTALGVYSFITLTRPGVRRMFAERAM